jgi:hypothetical protein
MTFSSCKGPSYVWRRSPPPEDHAIACPFKSSPLSVCLSEDTSRASDPDQQIEFFVTSVPHGHDLSRTNISAAPARLRVKSM